MLLRRSTSAHHDFPLSERERRGGRFASDPSRIRGVSGPCHKRLTAELNRRLLRERRGQWDEFDEHGCVVGPLCAGDSPKQPRSKETNGKRSRRSATVSWAWLDLNRRPHPDPKIYGEQARGNIRGGAGSDQGGALVAR